MPGDVRFALSAYDAGSEAVDRARGVPPYPETQQYVSRVVSLFGEPQAVASARRGPLVSRGTALSRQPAVPVRASATRAFRYVAGDGTVIYSNLPMESLPLTTRDRFTRKAAAPRAVVALAGRN